MKLPLLSNREQWLSALAIGVIVIGGYAWLRWLPANRDIGQLQQTAEATDLRVRTAEIPEEPDEDIERLKGQLAEQERVLAAIKEQSDSVEKHLAPNDSQFLIVNISKVARDAQIHVRINEVYKSPDSPNAVPAPAAPTSARKNRKNKAATPTPAVASAPAEAVIPPLSAGWIARMSPGSLLERPLRRLEVEGSYLALNHFIHDLDRLPFQVAVLRISVERMPVLAMPGYPQILLAEVILAL
jgi:HAMP domain-containing protein